MNTSPTLRVTCHRPWNSTVTVTVCYVITVRVLVYQQKKNPPRHLSLDLDVGGYSNCNKFIFSYTQTITGLLANNCHFILALCLIIFSLCFLNSHHDPQASPATASIFEALLLLGLTQSLLSNYSPSNSPNRWKFLRHMLPLGRCLTCLSQLIHQQLKPHNYRRCFDT